MALGDLALLRVHLISNSHVWETALGFECRSPFSDWRTQLGEEFRSTVMPDWLDGIVHQAEVLEYVVQDVVPGTAVDIIVPPTFHQRGALDLLMAPLNAAVCLSWRSDGTGRNTRGRSYLSGWPALWCEDGYRLAANAREWALTLAEVMFAQYGPTGFSSLARFVVISRGPHDDPLPVPQAFPLTHAVIPSAVRSMRKRSFL